jgi:hypothetical protein
VGPVLIFKKKKKNTDWEVTLPFVRYGTVVCTIFLKEVLVLEEETINNHHSHCISRGMRGNCHTIDECRNFERMGQIEDLIPCPCPEHLYIVRYPPSSVIKLLLRHFPRHLGGF